jgi:hypothetical protein
LLQSVPGSKKALPKAAGSDSDNEDEKPLPKNAKAPAKRKPAKQEVSSSESEESEDQDMSADDASKPLAGFAICMTGTLSIGRKEMTSKLEKLGATVTASVTKTTTHLLMSPDVSGTAKCNAAESKGVTCILETDLDRLIKNGSMPKTKSTLRPAPNSIPIPVSLPPPKASQARKKVKVQDEKAIEEEDEEADHECDNEKEQTETDQGNEENHQKHICECGHDYGSQYRKESHLRGPIHQAWMKQQEKKKKLQALAPTLTKDPIGPCDPAESEYNLLAGQYSDFQELSWSDFRALTSEDFETALSEAKVKAVHKPKLRRLLAHAKSTCGPVSTALDSTCHLDKLEDNLAVRVLSMCVTDLQELSPLRQVNIVLKQELDNSFR